MRPLPFVEYEFPFDRSVQADYELHATLSRKGRSTAEGFPDLEEAAIPGHARSIGMKPPPFLRILLENSVPRFRPKSFLRKSFSNPRLPPNELSVCEFDI